MKRIFTLFLVAVVGLFAAQLVQAQVVFTINSPGTIAGNVYPIGETSTDFNHIIQIGESVTGDVVVGLTNHPDSLGALMGCDNLINASEVAGKIALVRRGTPTGDPTSCYFSTKVWFAQEAGAIAAIVCNNLPGDEVIGMSGAGAYLGMDTIPACMISYNDCQTIIAAIEAGNTVNVTFGIPGFLDQAMSYSYHTPQDHIFPLENIRVRLVNVTGAEGNDITFTCAIEDPDGTITTLEEVVEVLPDGGDTTVTFDPYTPTVVGTYTGVFTNTFTSDVVTETFVITEDLFATDRGTPTLDAGNQTSFEEADSYHYHYGSLYQTAGEFSIATHISFGIGNVDSIFTGNPDYDQFTLVLYDGDADDDGELDFAASNASFDDLTAIGLGNYYLTGDETLQDILTVEIFATSGAEVIELDTFGAYYAVFKYDGDPTTANVCPRMAGTDDVGYFAFVTPLVIGNSFFNGGWLGAVCLSRLHIDETVNNVRDLKALDPAKARVFPNPAKENINLELNLDKVAQNVRVDILNFDGKVVGTYDLENVRKGVFPFNTEMLAGGTYFLSLKTPEGYKSLVFTIAR